MFIEPGAIATGTVVRVTEYGAIVRLSEGKMGLIHISEIAETYVRDVRDYLSEGDEVAVKVLRLNKGRYELSAKQSGVKITQMDRRAEPVRSAAPPERPVFDRRDQRAPVNFEDRLSRFLKDSEQRQHDIKRHMDSKRGRR